MPELKSTFTQEEVAQYMEDNNLAVYNHTQLASMLMNLDYRLRKLEQ